MTEAGRDRVVSLDLIRGVAVLGILAINIGGFAGPSVATLSPHVPYAGTSADEWAFALKFVLFEGKMRALFSLLFGASLVLFVERSDASGRFGDMLQLRRLGWLTLFGLVHFYLLWWGDILFLYAATGLLALMLRDMAIKPLVIAALAIFALWHTAGAAMSIPGVALEDRVLQQRASAAERREYADYYDLVLQNAAREARDLHGDFVTQVKSRAVRQPFQPFITAITTLGETLPLMMLGMALVRTGFFSGGWTRRSLWLTAGLCTASGLALTLALLGWAWPRGFPPRTMEAIYLYGAALPHLLMGTGYAALFVLATPALARRAPDRWLAATGRMAFTNYLGTTVLMTGIFYGWGLGWLGRFGDAWQWAFVLLGWGAMIVFSTTWLSRFRRGPLEWLWRSLVEQKVLANR